MSHPFDHDHVHDDALTLAALGEPLEDTTATHIATCDRCARELDQFTRTVELAREAADLPPVAAAEPPPGVWAGIAATLGLGDSTTAPAPTTRPPAQPPVAPVVPLDPGGARRRHRFRVALGAVAAAAVIGAGVGGFLLGNSDDPASPTAGACPTASARLAPVGSSTSTQAGEARIVCSADGPALQVSTDQLPLSAGYYEVWLYQPDTGVMVSVGSLGSNGSGTFTLPGGMDVREYPVVDVSAQKFDGNPAHGRSVLQGPLTS